MKARQLTPLRALSLLRQLEEVRRLDDSRSLRIVASCACNDLSEHIKYHLTKKKRRARRKNGRDA